LDLIPSYWDPYGFFCYKKLQNLWRKDWLIDAVYF
jgi:hypothetical protein